MEHRINILFFGKKTKMLHPFDSNTDTIKAYLKAKEKIMQRDATTEDVEKIMDFYSDTLYYEHVLSPEKKLYSMERMICEAVISHI